MKIEKTNTIQELKRANETLVGTDRLTMAGLASFQGGNNTTRQGMNNKHGIQHLAIDDPEFPMLYDGKENIAGEFSSYYKLAKKEYVVFDICKKFENLLHGNCKYVLYFLYCKDDDSYTLVERKEVENLTENFGFAYNNEFLDQLEIGEKIPVGSPLVKSRSYDEFGNVGVGVNMRTLFAVHPAVQDDAIIISESAAKRMVTNIVQTKMLLLPENCILLDLYHKKHNRYQGLPDIGDIIEEHSPTKGLICAARPKKEAQALCDDRNESLSHYIEGIDNGIFGNGEVIDINIFANNKEIHNDQINQYYTDGKWFWEKVYRTCKRIIQSGSKNIDSKVHQFMRRAQKYLNTDMNWNINDKEIKTALIQIDVREKECLNIGRKITGKKPAGVKVS